MSAVICIDDDFSMHPTIHLDYQELPVKNKIYNIREVRPPYAGSGVLLEEIKNKPVYFAQFNAYIEPAFAQRRFIPIVEIEHKLEIEEKVYLEI